MGRFIILSGPSCVGKGPLYAAFAKFYPDVAGRLTKLVLYNSRSPRPAEIDGRDYHFRQREQIESYRNKSNFIVLDVRGDLQAVDLAEADHVVSSGDLFYEGNPFIARKLQSAFLSRTDLLAIFLAPISREEVFVSPVTRAKCGAG
jgi:guanylate kinase